MCLRLYLLLNDEEYYRTDSDHSADWDDEEYDEEDEPDDEPEIYPDSLYRAAFRFSDTKLWKKLKKDDVFAVRTSDGSTVYCSVVGKRDEVTGLAVCFDARGLCEHLRPDHILAYSSAKELYDHIALQDKVFCAIVDKDEAETYAVEFAKENGFTGRGQKKYPEISRLYPEYVPCFAYDTGSAAIAYCASKYIPPLTFDFTSIRAMQFLDYCYIQKSL